MHVDCRFKAVALWHGQLCTGTVRRYPTKSEKPLSVTIPSFSLSSISHSAAFLLLLLLLLPFPLPLACFLFPAHSCRSIDLSLALPVFSFLSTEAAARCPRSTTCCDVQRALDDAPGQSKDSAHAAYAAVFRVIPYILFLMVGRDSRTLAHRPPRARKSFVGKACAWSANQSWYYPVKSLSHTPTTILLPVSRVDVRRYEKERVKETKNEKREKTVRESFLLKDCT